MKALDNARTPPRNGGITAEIKLSPSPRPPRALPCPRADRNCIRWIKLVSRARSNHITQPGRAATRDSAPLRSGLGGDPFQGKVRDQVAVDVVVVVVQQGGLHRSVVKVAHLGGRRKYPDDDRNVSGEYPLFTSLARIDDLAPPGRRLLGKRGEDVESQPTRGERARPPTNTSSSSSSFPVCCLMSYRHRQLTSKRIVVCVCTTTVTLAISYIGLVLKIVSPTTPSTHLRRHHRAFLLLVDWLSRPDDQPFPRYSTSLDHWSLDRTSLAGR